MISGGNDAIIINTLMAHIGLGGILIILAAAIAFIVVMMDTLPDWKPPSWWKY